MRLPGAMLLAVLILASSLAYGQDRKWVKTHHGIGKAGEVTAVWTQISVVGGFPFEERILYLDPRQRRLVIRFDMADATAPATDSIEYLETGELLRLRKDGDTLRATMGDEEFTFTRAECEAFSGPDGTECPPDVRAAAAAFIASASESFRSALSDFAKVGCARSVELYPVASIVGWLFFPDDVSCTEPPSRDDAERVGPADLDFDPRVVPPGEFESLFGDAYFE